jgi:hypothetical protein
VTPKVKFPLSFTCSYLDLEWSSPYPPPSHFLKIHLNIISNLHLGLPSVFFPSGFFTKTLHSPLLFPHTCYIPRPTHSARFDHLNNNEWGVQVIKLLMTARYLLFKMSWSAPAHGSVFLVFSKQQRWTGYGKRDGYRQQFKCDVVLVDLCYEVISVIYCPLAMQWALLYLPHSSSSFPALPPFSFGRISLGTCGEVLQSHWKFMNSLHAPVDKLLLFNL